MRFQKIGLTTVVLCTVGIQQSFSIDIVTKEKPNIVFILADDLGWTDLGVMGSDYYETPNIDRLATEGILFDNAYAAAANSAPSRACMMTGMYTPRHGVYTVSPPDRGDRTKRKYIAIPNVEDVCADFVTMAEALQDPMSFSTGSAGWLSQSQSTLMLFMTLMYSTLPFMYSCTPWEADAMLSRK